MSKIVKFMGRHQKAKSDGPFPWDRVFTSNREIEQFGDELIEFCEGYAEMADQNEKLQAQITAMQV